MARDRVPSHGRWSVPAAAVLVLAAASGCNIGHDRLRCTLDPAAIEVSGPVAGVCGPTVTVSGIAFDYGRCGVACPPPWTVRVRWRNLTTGETGEGLGSFTTSTCWPFSATSCQGATWSIDIPLAPGLNQVELEADEGDGFTACQTMALERYPGC